MKAFSLVLVTLICLAAKQTQSAENSRETSLPLAFWTADDIEDVNGPVRFGAEPLPIVGHADGFPEMQYACEAPDEAGGTWVYGWRNVDFSDRSKRAIEVLRCRTVDGKTFTDTQTVFRHLNKDWQGFSNIVRRPIDGALFLFSGSSGNFVGNSLRAIVRSSQRDVWK